MNIRRFELNISCASCVKQIDKVFKDFKDIKYTLNTLEKIISINADENKYSDKFIIDLIFKAGYAAERI